jgi:ribonuclease D
MPVYQEFPYQSSSFFGDLFMSLLTTNEEIRAFCAGLKGSDFITVDTEFLRERTYWPKLCLIQLGGADNAAAIDPLAEGVDLTPVFDLLADPSLLKVFHAAKQDIEIFYHMTGKIPHPFADYGHGNRLWRVG